MRIYSKVLKLSDLEPGRPAALVPCDGASVELPDEPEARGKYLTRLYDIDPEMHVGLLYGSRDDFHAKTRDKYR